MSTDVRYLAPGPDYSTSRVAWTFKLGFLLCIPSFIAVALYWSLGCFSSLWSLIANFDFVHIMNAFPYFVSLLLPAFFLRRHNLARTNLLSTKLAAAQNEVSIPSTAAERTYLTDAWIGAASIVFALCLPITLMVLSALWVNIRLNVYAGFLTVPKAVIFSAEACLILAPSIVICGIIYQIERSTIAETHRIKRIVTDKLLELE